MEFKRYLGKPMIAWLWYNPSYEERFGNTNIVCYLYPRVLMNDDFDTIDAEEDFPENGRIEVFIQGGQSAADIFHMFGPLVSVKLNREISPNYKGHNRYRVNYCPPSVSYSGASDISIERLSEKKFYQLLETEIGFDVLKKSLSMDCPEDAPFVGRVVVKTGGNLYGPFECARHGDKLFLGGLQEYEYQAGAYAWEEYSGLLLDISDNDSKRAARILPAAALDDPRTREETYDCISDRRLISSLAGVLSDDDALGTREFWERVETAVAGRENVSLTDERRERLQRLSKDLGAWKELADGVLATVLEDDASKDDLAARAVEGHFERIRDKLMERSGVREYAEELGREKADLERKIEEVRRGETELQRKREELQRGEAEVRGRAAAREEQASGAALQERRAALEAYERQIQDARARYDYERIQKERLDESLNALLRQYREEAGQITRLFDRALLDSLFRPSDGAQFVTERPDGAQPVAQRPDSASPVPQGASPADAELPPFQPSLLHAPLSREQLINRVGAYLVEKAGRVVTRNEVANYLICLSQGFLTTFVGKPGIGKTTLCGLLAKALGLVTGDAQNRYVEIPVERGWTSVRDFVGAWNPASRTTDIRNLEVWEALTRLDRERGDAYPPFLMLLDEANLSPIEHYWSVFLRNCDLKAGANRSISVGGGKNWLLPPHLRFFATVNFDHTMEKLSPRFLDRTWVITLDSFAILDGADDNPDNYGDMVSFASLREAFCPSGDAAPDEDVFNQWNALRNLFQRRQLPIMPRNLKMVWDYCTVACGCMDRDAPETRLAPLDYAFSQKILPTLNGGGELFRELVYDLRRECAPDRMPLTARHLERMQRMADRNQGIYQFFGRWSG